jgi:DNA-binding MarR family transcriptional regulator
MVFKKMTLKQLSEYLGKGKTTIHHHVKIFEEENILIWDEKEEDRKKLKTRHYALSNALMEELSNESVSVIKMELDALISKNLTNQMIDYFRKRSESAFNELKVPPIVSIPLNDEGLRIYEEFILKLIDLNNKEKQLREKNDHTQSINHFGSYLFVPIQKIFEWKLKQNTAED